MLITELNAPTLKFVKWERPLNEHPEFIRWRKTGHKQKDCPFLRIPGGNLELASVASAAAKEWPAFAATFCSDVWMTSVAYGKAFEKATDSLCKHRIEIFREMTGKAYCGTYVQATADVPICLLYSVRFHDVRQDGDTPDAVHLLWDGVILVLSGRDLVAAAFCESPKDAFGCAVPELAKSFLRQNGSVDAGVLFMVLDNLAFRKYVNVTVRDAKGRPARTPDGMPNDPEDEVSVRTTLPKVDRYDINWVTTTVRSAGFARRGFFRFQHKGPRGNQHLELVHVRPTWVKGYTRRARKPDAGVSLEDFETQN